MTEPTRFEEHDLTLDEAERARTYFDVMVKLGYAIPQMANIVGQMGKLLVDHSNEVVAKLNKGKVQ